eukprot:353762-Chlamydomonas_euryale.AAC.5
MEAFAPSRWCCLSAADQTQKPTQWVKSIVSCQVYMGRVHVIDGYTICHIVHLQSRMAVCSSKQSKMVQLRSLNIYMGAMPHISFGSALSDRSTRPKTHSSFDGQQLHGKVIVLLICHTSLILSVLLRSTQAHHLLAPSP